MNCNKVSNFLHEWVRMCESFSSDCSGCPFQSESGCYDFVLQNADNVSNIMQEWSAAHPKATLLDKFKREHPDAPLLKNGLPMCDPVSVGYFPGEVYYGLGLNPEEVWSLSEEEALSFYRESKPSDVMPETKTTEPKVIVNGTEVEMPKDLSVLIDKLTKAPEETVEKKERTISDFVSSSDLLNEIISNIFGLADK